jgi:hypothetical protein
MIFLAEQFLTDGIVPLLEMDNIEWPMSSSLIIIERGMFDGNRRLRCSSMELLCHLTNKLFSQINIFFFREWITNVLMFSFSVKQISHPWTSWPTVGLSLHELLGFVLGPLFGSARLEDVGDRLSAYFARILIDAVQPTVLLLGVDHLRKPTYGRTGAWRLEAEPCMGLASKAHGLASLSRGGLG